MSAHEVVKQKVERQRVAMVSTFLESDMIE